MAGLAFESRQNLPDIWRELDNFPLRLAPDLVRVITLNDDAALIDYAQPIMNELRAKMVRVNSDFSATPFKAKIANARLG